MLDPQVRAYLDRVAAQNLPPMESLPLPEARARFHATFEELGGAPDAVASVREVEAPGPRGAIPIRLYDPAGDGERRPLLVYYHGGGYTCGGLDCYDALCRRLANESGFTVASVDYRLAPEFPAPAPGEDAFAAFVWLSAHAADLGVDAQRIAVGGDSAGGGLAASVALRARDEAGAPILHQLLVYPAVASGEGAESAELFGTGHGLTTARMAFYWNCYVPRPELAELPYVLANGAATLRGLPPATVIIAECDPIRDMGVAYAERLRADGVQVELRIYPGMIHAFFSSIAMYDRARAAVADAGAALRNAANVATAR